MNCAVQMLPALLREHGVRLVVTSPGSRNAPLVDAVDRCKELHILTVVDERVSGFIALGSALQSRQPVALICTSGSAVLNYAPAVSEAYYRRVPLIVISADRPRRWIGQDDSQTMRQPGALAAVTEAMVDVDGQDAWETNRLINDALLTATARHRPVHINIQVDFEKPGCDAGEYSDRVIRMIKGPARLSTHEARQLAAPLLSPRRVMMVAGFMPPDERVNRAMRRLASRHNIAVIAEASSNLHFPEIISAPDALNLKDLPEELRPEVVITLGGSLVSARLKAYLRDLPKDTKHWHVGATDSTIDCYKHLSLRIDMEAADFLPSLASAMQCPNQPRSEFALRWHNLYANYLIRAAKGFREMPWSGLKAINAIVDMMPRRCNVHFSNGMAIRYAQLCNWERLHRCECNRGISGIDGSTSTAIGAALATADLTLLVTGDMSAQYDLGALICGAVPSNFRMVVLCNGGGAIFKMAKATSQSDACERRYVAPQAMPPLSEIARAVGFEVLEASDDEELKATFPRLIRRRESPALLLVHTDGNKDIKQYNQFINSI